MQRAAPQRKNPVKSSPQSLLTIPSLIRSFLLFVLLFFLSFAGAVCFLAFPGIALVVPNIGIIFAVISLALGTFFFLYSLRYYLSVAIVLSFSRQADHQHLSWGAYIARTFGITIRPKRARGRRDNKLVADLSKVRLKSQPFVSIHLSTFNELHVVDRLLTAATSMEYENYEVIVADDSNDETVVFLRKWEAHPRVKISHRNNRDGYKGQALALALTLTDPRAKYILLFDADFIPYPDTIVQFLKCFQLVKEGRVTTNRASRIVAVQGYQWHVLNKSENWITRGIRGEYAGSYVIERSATQIYGGLQQISGSVYMVKRKVVEKIGWGRSITEDFEFTLNLYEQGYKVVYTPYIQAPAEAVSTLKRLIRQRMRWAEGHSYNVKRMFWRLLLGRWEKTSKGKAFRKSPLTWQEKLEFLYLAPYYLQAGLFILGTASWFLAETIFRSRLAFWTATWGWSLIFTNLLALPLMNLVGLFMEEAEEKDYLGLLSFIILSYVVAPFQAYAAVKGFLERKEEGKWFRTPKTGKITDSFAFGKVYRVVKSLFKPGTSPVPSSYLALVTANNGFNRFEIRSRRMKWVGKASFAFLLICVLLVNSLALGVKPSEAWYNSGYLYRKLLTIDHTQVSGGSNLSSFPVLVSFTDSLLKTSANGGRVQNSNGYDIVFADTNDVKLDHEIEKFVGTTGQIVMWVRIPTLSASTDTQIYLYYDNSAISTSQENKTGVWDSNYKGVWHLKEASGTTNANSTSTSSIDGTKVSASSPNPATGQVDGAQSFNGTSDTVTVLDNNALDFGANQDFTVGAWVKSSQSAVASTWPMIVSKEDGNDTRQGYNLVLHNSNNDSKWYFEIFTSGNAWGVTGTGDIADGNWHYLVGKRSGSTIYSKQDGTAANSLSASSASVSKAIALDFGSQSGGVTGFLNGTIDEVRISNVARSDGWIATEYNTMKNQGVGGFIKTEGSEEQVPELTLLLLPVVVILPGLAFSWRRRQEESI